MKTLLLMRHAKSSWKDKELSDMERPLNKRGQRDAPRMGRLLVERELIPQRILSSTAVRSSQTAEALLATIAETADEAAGFLGEVEFQDALYMAEAEEYINTLRQQPDDLERIMIIGHNPGLETLLQMLSGRIEALPTAVLAHLVLPIQRWADINGDTGGELVEIWRPKELSEIDLEREQAESDKKRKGKEKGKKKKKEK